MALLQADVLRGDADAGQMLRCKSGRSASVQALRSELMYQSGRHRDGLNP